MQGTIPDYKVEEMRDRDFTFAYDLHVCCEGDGAVDWDQFNLMCCSAGCYGVVAKLDEDIVGYLVYHVDIDAKSVEILFCGVDRCFRRISIGSSMIEWLKVRVMLRNLFTKIYCAVESSNDAGYELLREQEFFCCQLKPTGSGENVYVMRFCLQSKTKLTREVRFQI